MTRYKAMFFIVDGLEETVVGSSYGLTAETLQQAEMKALSLPRPTRANFLKVLDDGRVVSRRVLSD